MKKELIKRIEALPAKDGKGRPFVDKKIVIGLIQTMDEPKQPTLDNIIHRIKFMEEDLKQEWISKILKELGSEFEQKKFQEGFKLGSWIGRQLINADKIRQKLNKPVVKQFVADWYEEHKDDFEFNIWDWVAYSDESEKLENKEFNSWINDSEGNPIQTLVNMHQLGYEVEEEKRYTIRFKNIRKETRYLKYDRVVENWHFGVEQCSKETKISHTRKELEGAGFGWVFDCEGIEVKEVE